MILVTGAGGKTGDAVIRAVHSAGASVRALVHSKAAISRAEAAGADQTRIGDLHDRSQLLLALRSVNAVYAVFPNMAPNELDMMASLIECAKERSVRHVVYHSVLHPQTEKMPHHWQKMRAEEKLLESGLEFTVLQPAAYMQNLKGYWQEITSRGIYKVPYPVGTQLSMVDLGDVATAAAVVLTENGHMGATYELCGPEPLTQDQVAEAVGQVVGRKVEAQEVSVKAWLARASTKRLGAYQRRALAAMFRYYAEHGLVGNPNVLAWLIGRPPRNLPDVLARDFGHAP